MVGYYSEYGHHLLVHEFHKNDSLHDYLHLPEEYTKLLIWNTSVKIALGTARALEYLHEVCLPSVVHKNFKSVNILLGVGLNPLLTDRGGSRRQWVMVGIFQVHCGHVLIRKLHHRSFYVIGRSTTNGDVLRSTHQYLCFFTGRRNILSSVLNDLYHFVLAMLELKVQTVQPIIMSYGIKISSQLMGCSPL